MVKRLVSEKVKEALKNVKALRNKKENQLNDADIKALVIYLAKKDGILK